jgi:hypothetical protein
VSAVYLDVRWDSLDWLVVASYALSRQCACLPPSYLAYAEMALKDKGHRLARGTTSLSC